MTLSFKQYDIIILDEPTNHLDMNIKIKLSDYLISTKSIVVCVTHDRWFINQRVTQVRAFGHGTIKTYPGNYDDYQILLEQEHLSQQRAHESVAKELDRQAQVLAEFKRRSKISSDPARGKMIRTRSKIIERMQDKQVESVVQDKKISLTATSLTRTGKELIKLKHHDVSIAGRTLISNINLTIHSGDKIALI
jgi:ATPase subunit of ABC transporter with duplicated ATPase domains